MLSLYLIQLISSLLYKLTDDPELIKTEFELFEINEFNRIINTLIQNNDWDSIAKLYEIQSITYRNIYSNTKDLYFGRLMTSFVDILISSIYYYKSGSKNYAESMIKSNIEFYDEKLQIVFSNMDDCKEWFEGLWLEFKADSLALFDYNTAWSLYDLAIQNQEPYYLEWDQSTHFDLFWTTVFQNEFINEKKSLVNYKNFLVINAILNTLCHWFFPIGSLLYYRISLPHSNVHQCLN